MDDIPWFKADKRRHKQGEILSDFKQKFLYLSIHSMLHMKDLDHSLEMEKLESKYFKKDNI
jgi:ssRNA-specific RNase YbeY (16S rRNA maturation enzyme)